MLDRNQLNQQYASGKKQFYEAQLEQADLESIFLSQINLSKANLNLANLKDADLSDGNLSESSLVGTELSRAHLSRINLSHANLSNANFSESILTRANFTGACLEKACLTSAILIEANFNQANLFGANLNEVDLSTTNLKGAFYDDDTSFPLGFEPTSKGLVKQCTIEGLLERLNHLFQSGNKYLGNTMTAKYFDSSRPSSDWLNQFTIDSSGDSASQINYQGNLSDTATLEQLQLFQQWLDSFTKSCSRIIKDFSKMIQL